MRRRALLPLPALVLGLLMASGAAAGPASADPPAVATGDILIDPASFQLTQGKTTGAVSRFSFSFRTTVVGDFQGTTSESFDCQRTGDVVRCWGGGTSLAADGTTGSIHAVLTCTPELSCTGRGQFRGVTPNGERLIWMSEITSVAPFRSSYVSRVVHGPS